MARREFQDPSILVNHGKQGPEYYIRYRVKVVRMVDGKAKLSRREKWHVLGLCSAMTERQAKREKEKIMREVNGQVYSIQSHIPFRDFVRLYRERRLPELRTPTRKTYDQNLRIYIEPYFGDKKLCDIKPEEVHLFLSSLPVAPLTRKTIRGVLSSIFNLAIAWGYWLEQSPVKLAFLVKKMPGTLKHERKIWTAEELQRILLAVRPDVNLIIRTLVWTGMRISECLGLRWKNVDLKRGLIKVVERQCRGDVDAPKSAKGRRLLVLGELADEYAALRGSAGDDDLVFSDNGEPYVDCELLANYLSPLLAKMGLKFPRSGWHTIRRMHLSWFSEEGASAFEVRDQAGHSSIETTMLYIFTGTARQDGFVRSMQSTFRKKCGPDAGSGVPN